MKYVRTWLIALALILAAASSTLAAEEQHVFILSGQSNMAGLDPNISFTPAVEAAFGKDRVIVVKDAHGGQPMRRWYKEWKPARGSQPKATGDLYDRLMKKVNAAIKGKKIKTVTFVWMQGEKDAREKHGEVYAASFKGLIDQLKGDLKHEDINFVIGRLSDFDMNDRTYRHWTIVRKAIVEAAEADPRGAWVDTDDLNDGKNKAGKTIKNDLHYSVEGYKTLGKRFAEKAIAQIQAEPKAGGEEKIFDSMDRISAWKWDKKKSDISTEKEKGEDGSAITFKVAKGKNFAIAMRIFSTSKSWDDFDGIVMRVKGDGSKNFGCIRIQCGGWAKGYNANFPLADADWHDVQVAWSDFVPATHSTPALGSARGYKPSNVNLFALGKSWNFSTTHTSPAITFSVDTIKLVKGIAGSRKRIALDKLPPVSSVVARMKAGKPVTILALGDSITWGTSAGGNANAYPKLITDKLRARFKNNNITVISAAIGGSTTSKGRQWMMRDVAGRQADLVTIMFGFNEMCRKPEERAKRTSEFTANLILYVEEVAGLMDSPPAAVFLATVPGRQAHWEDLDCYAEGVRKLKDKHPNITIADVGGYMKALGKEKYRPFMGDEAHPNAEGHKQMAEVVFKAIIGSEKR